MYVHLYVWKLTRRHLYMYIVHGNGICRKWECMNVSLNAHDCALRDRLYTPNEVAGSSYWGDWAKSESACTRTREHVRICASWFAKAYVGDSYVYTCQNVGARYVLGKCTRVCVMRFVVCIHVLYVFKRTYMDACSCAYAYVCERM